MSLLSSPPLLSPATALSLLHLATAGGGGGGGGGASRPPPSRRAAAALPSSPPPPATPVPRLAAAARALAVSHFAACAQEGASGLRSLTFGARDRSVEGALRRRRRRSPPERLGQRQGVDDGGLLVRGRGSRRLEYLVGELRCAVAHPGEAVAVAWKGGAEEEKKSVRVCVCVCVRERERGSARGFRRRVRSSRGEKEKRLQKTESKTHPRWRATLAVSCTARKKP